MLLHLPNKWLILHSVTQWRPVEIKDEETTMHDYDLELLQGHWTLRMMSAVMFYAALRHLKFLNKGTNNSSTITNSYS